MVETLDARVGESDLPPLIIKGRMTHPVVQGGMGVGVSNGQLAGAVAREGGIGTLSSVGLAWIDKYKKTFLHTLMREAKENPGMYATFKTDKQYEQFLSEVLKRCEAAKISPPTEKKIQETYKVYQLFHEATIRAAREEIIKAQAISGGKGALWLNTMFAINEYKQHVRLACEMGLNGIVSGAGVPTSLPDLVQGYPNTALIPIMSNLQGASLIYRQWSKKGRLPDAIVLEDPTRAAGHLGIATVRDLDTDIVASMDTKKNVTLEVAVPAVRRFLDEQQGDGPFIPVIAAGGITSHEDMLRYTELGASGFQLGTRFLASHESGANSAFKNAVIGVDSIGALRRYNSNAMLPAQGIAISGVFPRIEGKEAKAISCAENCLVHCALRDGIQSSPQGEEYAQMCILDELAYSVSESGGSRGLFFAGTSAVQIDTIDSVENIMRGLLRHGS